jgi:hypothetical protein
LDSNFADKDHAVVLMAPISLFSECIVRRYFQNKGFPVVVFQHGSVWFDKSITQRNDLSGMTNASLLLTYGDAVTKAFMKSDMVEKCDVKSIGSMSLDEIRKTSYRSDNPKRHACRLLYVITSYYNNSWYCGFSPPFNDRLYYLEQMVIVKWLIRFAATMENIFVTIKLHPHLHNDPPWITDVKDQRNINLVRNPEFVELLTEHDLILIDSPTTTLLQSISTRLPVYVLTSIIKPSPSDIHLLKKRAVCTESAETLMAGIEDYLKTGFYPADVNDNKYLNLYGTHLDDGKSADRVLTILEGLTEKKVTPQQLVL